MNNSNLRSLMEEAPIYRTFNALLTTERTMLGPIILWDNYWSWRVSKFTLRKEYLKIG
jgi:hypothetical protein